MIPLARMIPFMASNSLYVGSSPANVICKASFLKAVVVSAPIALAAAFLQATNGPLTLFALTVTGLNIVLLSVRVMAIGICSFTTAYATPSVWLINWLVTETVAPNRYGDGTILSIAIVLSVNAALSPAHSPSMAATVGHT